MALDVCSLLVLFWDLTIIPFVIAWDVPLKGFLYLAAWATLGFWTMDLCMSFLTGYQQSGEVVMDSKAIARRYLRTWFIPDISLVVMDFVGLLLTATMTDRSYSGTVKVVRFVRMGRLIRIVTIFRVLKLSQVFDELFEQINSDVIRLVSKTAALFFMVMWATHMVSCAWFACGRLAPTDTGARWVDAAMFEDTDWAYQYFTSIHWTVAQLTLGAIEVTCQNTSERIFNVVCLFVGLLFGSVLVSSLAAALVELQEYSRERNQKLRTLRRYLDEHNVCHSMALRVKDQVAERLGKRCKLTNEDVSALGLISSSLLAELRFEVFGASLITHPLFRLWTSLNKDSILLLCCTGVEYKILRSSDDLFLAGERAEHSYCVVAGQISYTQDPFTSPVHEVTVTDVNKHNWLTEAALWSYWIYVGTATAVSSSEVLAVQAVEIGKAMQSNVNLERITREYSKQFHKRTVSASPPSAPWPSDIEVPFTDYGDLVAAMDLGIRTTIGTNALEQCEHKRAYGPFVSVRYKLREEVSRGKSTVVINGKGDLERIVSVAAIRIESNGYIFAQIGKVEDSGVVPACQLPGGKYGTGELTTDVLQRLFGGKLASIASNVKLVRTERLVEWRNSKEYGVRTKYFRTVCCMHLTSPIVAPSCTVESTLQTPPAPLITEVLSREVFVLSDDGKSAFFAWLTPSEFEQLSDSNAVVEEWLSYLRAPEPKNVKLSF